MHPYNEGKYKKKLKLVKKILVMVAVAMMPAAKFNWLRMKNFGMYSKLAAGLTFASKKEDYSKGNTPNQSESKVGFNFQVSAIGFEAGSENIRAFAELGVGEQGIILAGVRAKF